MQPVPWRMHDVIGALASWSPSYLMHVTKSEKSNHTSENAAQNPVDLLSLDNVYLVRGKILELDY